MVREVGKLNVSKIQKCGDKLSITHFLPSKNVVNFFFEVHVYKIQK